ncbi:MAG: zinc-dependent metalloprotease [Verrucomicrobiales bacterium]|nr:zinc-dependent metalloprotease [Verrucomicrobiales bacterium]
MRKSPLFMELSATTRLFLILALSLPAFLSAEEKETEDEKEEVTIEKILEDCDTLTGLFPLHQNRENGKTYLQVSADQLSDDETTKEYIHFSHTLDGVTDLGFFRGQFSNARVFKIRRHFEKIEFVARNTSFYFNPDSALKRASEANISEAILASQKIEAKDDEKGILLIEADSIFLKEFFRQLKSGKSKDDKGDTFKLGDLSKDRTRFLESKSFPDNTLFRVQYVFENLHPSEYGDEDVTDSRFVTIKVQHTLMAMPENDYEPRFDDARVGYFTTQVTDLTSKSSAPYRDFIHRWHLEKQDPEAEKSDPVEPITWWIENTTPMEIRDTIRDAVLAWNPAFESAGITNAIEVKIQPDDAEWDSDDIRYHVLRWTSSPNPPFGGYGPSFVNPRTGQILGADIMLEYVYLTNRIRLQEIVKLGGSEATTSSSPGLQRGHQCSHGACLHSSRIAGAAILRAQAARLGNGPVDEGELIRQGLTELILHEVGHTIGLNHNFRASHLYDRKQAHNTQLTSKTGVCASVMDYASVNLALNPDEQGHYFSIVPGPYDHWAVRAGYGSEDKLNEVLSESTKPQHAFANDADDMRKTGRGIDPRAMINDLTNEPIENAVDRITLVKQTLPKLKAQFPVEGESYHELRTAFATLMREYERSVITISRFIGGVKIDRSLHGQNGAAPEPLTPLSEEEQKKALAALNNHLFGPSAISYPDGLISKLQLQRRGFEFFTLDQNEDPKIHDSVLGMQKQVLDQILHPHTLERMIDSGLYGNTYEIGTFMSELDELIMEGDAEQIPGTFREALQIEYVDRLIRMSGLEDDSTHPAAVRSEAVRLLTERSARLNAGQYQGLPRHQTFLTRRIANALAPK